MVSHTPATTLHMVVHGFGGILMIDSRVIALNLVHMGTAKDD